MDTHRPPLWEDGPVWQDDTDAVTCFLCHSSYNFFNRRHHCRKCGRVVCGSCSEQAVKYFPNTVIVDAPGARARASEHESYRTCDECASEIRMIRRALFAGAGSSDDDDDAPEPGSRASSVVSSGSSAEVAASRSPYSHQNDSTTKYSTRTNTLVVQSLTSSVNEPRRTPRDNDSDSNLCPVCASDLLKVYIQSLTKSTRVFSNEDFEQYKESHINECLVAYDFSHDDNDRFASPLAHPRNKMLVYNIPPIPRPQYESIPSQMGSSSVVTIPQVGAPVFGDSSDGIGSVTSNSTLPPSAEKDAELDNECVICLEDLKPGDKVARLECLCVFHYKCIKFWFNKKGYGECPVHFLHK
ncbi:FYVE-domain-containing protein [Suhomyces tanzawaensis NRRL Y-17324]|uniref:RING-type E3 ubiquitin transferase n=1 Tax=Suhomyces tanzawaensis NRRL Y-17324 TaxID=984487 RepID=A0A1E4SNY7_9ASCO|nr:FYVE-domain-containing protein [Suhomyces tanzawaensis NRRL Y-17324]ODV81102.1 FYVE-domain-containing protein [Suhomyces tanzawaensis NRRL Y-17324]